MIKKIFIKTYGCQMNTYDSIRIQEIFNKIEIKVTDDIMEADVIVFNTCHIREKASEKLYSELGRVKKIKEKKLLLEKSDTIIIVAGCVGQAQGKEVFNHASYVDIVVGPQSYHKLPILIDELKKSKKKLVNLDFLKEEKFGDLPAEESKHKICAFLPIQEGCNKFCTFCVVPYTRGAEFSRSPEAIYRDLVILVNNGAKEINLLGQNVNAYCAQSTSNSQLFSLADLIYYISDIKGLERIRYTTSHPRDMNENLIRAHGQVNKLVPFLHLPIQSGSNKMLKLMNRKHTREEYLEIVAKLRAVRSDMVFSSDFIVGFPGESDEDFADTIDLIKKVRYAQCYSFKYSPRPGTPAAALEKQVPEKLKSERLKILQKELAKQQLEFNESSIGRILPVLLDKKGKHNNQLIGKTPYMQSTYIDNVSEVLIGKVINAKITKAVSTRIEGLVI